MKIGMLGGGQLARMFALAAYPLDIEIVCIDPKPDTAAKKVTNVIQCSFDQFAVIDKHFYGVDCVSYETENLPIDCVEIIANNYPLCPNIKALRITQDRLYEKNFLRQLKIPVADFLPIDNRDDLKKAIEQFNFPVILKTRRSGYDGKGQMIIHNHRDADHAWEIFSSHLLIAEMLVPFTFEVSLISVRSHEGDVIFYPLILNEHKNGILRKSMAPYVDAVLQNYAEKYSVTILEALDYVGVMTIEFFCVNGTLIVNEIAPRVHNSGHWTIEGADTSQFENHLRAITKLPLGSTKPKGFSVMYNLLGRKQSMENFLKIPGLHYHWYGKLPAPMRKLGHLTLCADDEKTLAINESRIISSGLE